MIIALVSFFSLALRGSQTGQHISLGYSVEHEACRVAPGALAVTIFVEQMFDTKV